MSKNDLMEEAKNKSTVSKIIEETKKTSDESKNSENTKQLDNSKTHRKRNKKKKKKKTLKQKLMILLTILISIILLFVIFVFLFFKTSLFQKYKELWVVTAMSTMKHQYLARWFLSDEEIAEILKKLEVQNNENSDSNNISIDENITETEKEISVEKITGKNYVGFVMTIPDPSKVKLVDGRLSSRGSKLSEIVKKNNAVGGINAGGFTDENGVGSGNSLCRTTIINKKMQYGSKSSRYSLIGLTSDSKLVLGKYNYQEAIAQGIESAIEFGPYLIVNGNNQITNANSGGIHPRTAIGQKQDGTMIFVVIDGRQVGYSIGTNLLELQNIFNKYDAYNAANLDGGSSSTMYYNGKLVNKPSTPAGQRYLPNAFIVTE